MNDDTYMSEIILIAHNVRSCHNVGSMLRTADGLGVHKVYLTGYTPYPICSEDARLPHLARKIDSQIHKTALGAEQSVTWQQHERIDDVIIELRSAGFTMVGLEQHKRAVLLPTFEPPEKVALVVGREVEGIEPEVLAACDFIVEIPMSGQKESFNVAAAAAMTLYHLTLAPLR